MKIEPGTKLSRWRVDERFCDEHYDDHSDANKVVRDAPPNEHWQDHDALRHQMLSCWRVNDPRHLEIANNFKRGSAET